MLPKKDIDGSFKLKGFAPTTQHILDNGTVGDIFAYYNAQEGKMIWYTQMTEGQLLELHIFDESFLQIKEFEITLESSKWKTNDSGIYYLHNLIFNERENINSILFKTLQLAPLDYEEGIKLANSGIILDRFQFSDNQLTFKCNTKKPTENIKVKVIALW